MELFYSDIIPRYAEDGWSKPSTLVCIKIGKST